jgi:hypothetical protein
MCLNLTSRATITGLYQQKAETSLPECFRSPNQVFTLQKLMMEPVCQKDHNIRIPSAINMVVIIMPL